MPFILPALLIFGYYLGGLFNGLILLFVFIAIPLMDYLVGLDTDNVPEKSLKPESRAFYYRMITYLWVYVQLGVLLWATWVFAYGNLANFYEKAMFIMGVALITGGIGITVAHEQGHKKAWIERFYSKVLLMMVCYMHFYVEHNRGHHVTVATPEDPATARKNEPFYAFWVRSVVGSYRHAWHLASERVRRKSLSWYQHEMIGFTLAPILFCAVLTLAVSWPAGQILWEIPVFFVAQSVLAFTLLEQVNYIEHYGIVRKEVSPGRYERVRPVHSWNASQRVSNFFLFQLQRHSDHHANASKPYQVLNHYDESPQLPQGYSFMIMIALVPPLWFGMMNNRLESWQDEQHTNLQAAAA